MRSGTSPGGRLGMTVVAEDAKAVSRNSVRRTWKKSLSANVNGDQEQRKPNPPETVIEAKHLFYKGGRNHAQNSK
jgi:RNase P protein component